MKANEIKITFIKWLLDKYPKSIIGNEVLFSINQYRTDILQILLNKTYAFEIKSDSDNLESINEQLHNYLTTFDYTNLIFTEKYSIEKLKTLDDRIGLYLITNNKKVKKIRSPKISKELDKRNLLAIFSKTEILKLLNKKNLSKLSVYELREKALKISKKTIKEKALDIFKTRYSKLLELFMLDTNGNIVTEDDLTSLTGNVLTNKIH